MRLLLPTRAYVTVAATEMETVAILLPLTCTWLSLSVVDCNPFGHLPCDSYLRPSLPQFFTHCCTYGNFSEWKLSSFMAVPTNQCISGYVVVETRVRIAITGDCSNQTEERISECKQHNHHIRESMTRFPIYQLAL